VSRLGEPRVLDLAGDEMVSHLLLVHGLHPLDLRTRIAGALEEVRPYLRSHGGEVELDAIEPPTVRLRLRGSCHGCPSSTVTLKLAIEAAIRKAAPEIEHVDAGDGTVVRPEAPALSCPEPLGMTLPMAS
jgi:Fe-S cluster biogenesis protein NfuA